jgi:hypothetical protein
MRNSRIVVAVLAVMILTAFALPAVAQTEKDWDFTLAPLYVWMTNMEGDMTVRNNNVPVEADFGELFDKLDQVLTFHVEGWYQQRWGVFFDYFYTQLKDGTDAPPIDATIKNSFMELAFLYRYTSGDHALDALAGFRYTNMDVKLDVGMLPMRIDRDKNWTDPIIGLRWNWGFGEQWSLMARGDIGGFGVGTDFAWNLVGLVEWRPWKSVSFIGGYKALNQDYDEGDFKYDVLMHGPVLGVNIYF